MKQAILKTGFLLVSLLVMGSMNGITILKACDKTAIIKKTLLPGKIHHKKLTKASPQTEEYTDIILTNSILRF
ncbi:MAG TPA: hypothetical protein VFQ73_16325 [Flavisolibacter sp.]|nr:hypothetical protein [Flavisolibacter sp.]